MYESNYRSLHFQDEVLMNIFVVLVKVLSAYPAVVIIYCYEGWHLLGVTEGSLVMTANDKNPFFYILTSTLFSKGGVVNSRGPDDYSMGDIEIAYRVVKINYN
jgi:hypothetical protein